MSEQISIWLVEDDASYAQTLRYLIDRFSGLRCLEHFISLEEIQAHWKNHPEGVVPDVVLLDIELPGVDGIRGIEVLKGRFPNLTILMLTFHDAPDMIFRALKAGASGYVIKDTPIDDMVESIRHALRGGLLMPPSVAHKVLGFFNSAKSVSDYRLTDREVDVLTEMCRGLSQKEIASALSIATNTVDNHVRSIYRKMHVHSGIEAVSKALREGLV